MDIHFTKMHGLGNDFIVLNNLHNEYQLSAEQISVLSHRQLGVGFDQLLSVEASAEPGIDFSYRIFNQDGQEAEHCGNGARCFAKYVVDKGLFDGDTLVVVTKNFSELLPSFSRFGTAKNKTLTERFTRVDYSTINYDWTLEDPSTFTDRISATLPITKVAGQLYEYGCHEGNYGMENILRGERMSELRATDAGDGD